MLSKEKQKFYQGDKKNVLVTGGAGFIGSHLCDYLIGRGDNVICVDNFFSSNVENIKHLLQKPNFRLLKYDINQSIDFSKFPELKDFQIELRGIQEIYHLACPTSIKNFDNSTVQILYTNIFGTINVLELAKFFKSKLLFTSSSVVYGLGGDDQIKETDLGSVDSIGPRACYDEGKRISETSISTYIKKYNLDAKIARIFRVYGPREMLFDGQMIPDFALQALNNKPLIIYGDEKFATSLCYIDDIIQGLVRIMDSKELGPFNLGDSHKYFVAKLAQQIIDLTGSSSSIKFKKSLSFMRPLGLPDTSLIKEKLEWFPVITLDTGLKKMIDYVKANRILLQPLVERYDKE